MPVSNVSQNLEFCIQNEKLCIKNEEFFIENGELLQLATCGSISGSGSGGHYSNSCGVVGMVLCDDICVPAISPTLCKEYFARTLSYQDQPISLWTTSDALESACTTLPGCSYAQPIQQTWPTRPICPVHFANEVAKADGGGQLATIDIHRAIPANVLDAKCWEGCSFRAFVDEYVPTCDLNVITEGTIACPAGCDSIDADGECDAVGMVQCGSACVPAATTMPSCDIHFAAALQCYTDETAPANCPTVHYSTNPLLPATDQPRFPLQARLSGGNVGGLCYAGCTYTAAVAESFPVCDLDPSTNGEFGRNCPTGCTFIQASKCDTYSRFLIEYEHERVRGDWLWTDDTQNDDHVFCRFVREIPPIVPSIPGDELPLVVNEDGPSVEYIVQLLTQPRYDVNVTIRPDRQVRFILQIMDFVLKIMGFVLQIMGF